MTKRPTLRDIAKLAKVTHVTVSRALRKHPSIPERTRTRIEAIAKKIGYRPDPALSALMVYRRGAKPSGYQGVLAWINTFHKPELPNQPGEYRLYFEGARERCAELGYRLEEFRLADLGMRTDRLSKILYARNIQGVFWGPQERDRAHISLRGFDWEKFSLITFGFTLARPRLHVVTNAQFRSARIAVRKLRSLGYRRIGLTLPLNTNQRTDGNFLGGFLVEQVRFSPGERIPVFYSSTKGEKDGKADFRKWFRKHRPDALFDLAESHLQMTAAELRHCGIAIITLPEEPSGHAGIHQNARLIGRTGVNELIAMIHANERGIPAIPRRILIEGRWMDGPSAPRIAVPASRKE